MSFDTEVVKPNRGRALRVDVSVDNFETISYRWGDQAGNLDATNHYDNRVLELGPVRRALGQNRVAASSTTTLTLDNADGVLDFMCGSTGLATASAMRFRIYVVIYDVVTYPASSGLHAKQLGEFVLSSWPSQDRERVSLNLADDMMGMLGPGLQLPTFVDWSAVGSASTNPLSGGTLGGLPDSISQYAPIQLAFGEDWLLTHPHIIPIDHNAGGDTYRDKVIIPLYCTTDLTAVSQSLVTQLRVERYARPAGLDSPDGVPELVDIPRTVGDFALGTGTPATLTVWTVEKSPTITKAGRDFQIVYLVVRTDLGDRSLYYAVQDEAAPELFAQRMTQLSAYAFSGGYSIDAVLSDSHGATGPGGGGGGSYAPITSRVMRWHVKGVPLSQRTNAPTVAGAHAVDVIQDLVSVYSDATVDSTSFGRVKAGNANARCFGVVQAWSERANSAALYQPPMSLRQVLTQLAQSSDLDIFVNWAGQIALASDVWDFTTSTQEATLLEFFEEELSNTRRWVPSDGERHSAFNRVYFEGGRSNPAEGRGFGLGGYGNTGLPFQGPWDLDDATIPVTTRIIEVGLQQGWRPFAQQREDPLQWRQVDAVARDRMTTTLGMNALRLELGDYFKLTWSRGTSIGGPYSATVFQCEAITYNPADDTVELEAVWRDDTTTEYQYLCDDETLLVRAKGGLSGNAIPDGSDVVDFDGTINLATMGVVSGDILILRDTSQAADVFTRNGAWRIADVYDTKSFNIVSNGEAAYPAAGTVANAQWSIVRGQTTYPTAVSDPTNYPSGGDMYGKVTDSSGVFSGSPAQGNRLISG